MEAGLVFDKRGDALYWHLPLDRGCASIPDSRILWDVLWENRAHLGGVAHSHPGDGIPSPSGTDVTTFAAVEAGLGRRLVWPIVTFTDTRYFVWDGPDRLGYGMMDMRRFRLGRSDIEHLRALSR